MDILGFALAVLVIELTPGPNMAWLAGLAATEGNRCGLAAVAGVAIGLLANGILAALGLAAAIEAIPGIWIILRVAGAAMMLWLAIEAWRGTETTGSHIGATPSPRKAFATGAMINLLNPKAYIFFVVVAPQFLNGATLSISNAMIFALISVTIATSIHLAIVFAGGHAHGWLMDPGRTKATRRAFAVIMLVVALSFLIGDFRRP
jgi:threonine/homoserine/homoserine lactone efflux protein